MKARDGVVREWANHRLPPGIFLIGVDEAGRGPLAGPVVAGAVCLHEPNLIQGLACSKSMSEKRRNAVFPVIQRDARAWAIASASVDEIDQFNILQASLLAMKRAVEQVADALVRSGVPPQALFVAVDGNRVPKWSYPSVAVIKGDAQVPAISAGSILAKVHRDTLCQQLHLAYPDYGFDQHMGYPTPTHLERLTRFGPTPEHRKSFGPVRDALGLF